MAPVYEFQCGRCKDDEGHEKNFEVVKPIARSGEPESCPDCGAPAERVYSFSKAKEFIPFYDEKYGKVVTSSKHHEKLMKKHGEIYTRDVPRTDRTKEQIKQWKFRKSRGLV